MKLIKKLLLLAAVAILALFLAGWLLVPPAAKGAVEQGSRYAFGVPTSLGSVGAKLGFGTSGVAIEDYRVSSPEGFDGKPLLQVGRLALGVGTTSLVGEPKVVDELVLEGLELNLVQNGTSNNLLPVLQSVRKLLQGGEPTPPSGEGAPSGPGPRVRIQRVRIAGLAASVEVKGIPGIPDMSKRFELPAYDADWSKLTGQDGVTVAELSGKLLEEVSASALVQADAHLPGPVAQLLRATVDGGLDGGFGGALDAARSKLGEEARKGLDSARERLLEGVEDLSGKLPGGVGDTLKGILEGDGKDGDPTLPSKDDVQQKVEEQLQKGADEAKKKAGEALEKALPGGTKKLFGGGSGG
jgi:hypothetical protein